MTVRLQKYLLMLLVLAAFNSVAQTAEYLSPGLTPEQVLQQQQNGYAPLVVDVRKSVEFKVAHIPGAINIPLAEIETRLDELKHDNGVLLYCINGTRTREAEAIVMTAGWPKVYHLKGSFSAWIQGEYPVEKGGADKASW